MKNIFASLLAIVALSLTACGSDGGNGGGPGVNSLSCDQQWSSLQTQNPVGFSKTYKSTLTYNGMAPHVVEKTTRVTESNSQHIVTETTENSQKTMNEVTRDNFINMCSQYIDQQQDNSNVVAQGNQVITVAAGTFDCQFIKTVSNSDSDVMSSSNEHTTWTTMINGVFVTVKQVSVFSSTAAGHTSTSETTMELTKVSF